ncbi:hypothetical protein, partial [Campylobacter pinnipediorum]|uniref:hypothetical protein n=1 Tax=Campylobacter pinnipediorum TaxID=1965231 RepID=UPI00112F94A0
MKISMIASATIIGAMMTINVYGSSSLDEINNAQKEKSDFIKKLEEVSKDGFLDKFKKEKEKIEKEKDEILKPQKEAEKLKQQVEQAETAAKEAEEQRKVAEKQAQQAQQAQQAAKKQVEQAKTAKNKSEEQKQQAETKKQQAEKEAFDNSGKTKALNDKVKELIELKEVLQELDRNKFQTSKQDLEQAMGVFTDDEYNEDKLEELLKDTNGNQNNKKLEIIEKLYKIGLVQENKFDELKAKKIKQKQQLATELNGIIGNNGGAGLRKLIGDTRDDADKIKKELEAIITARDKIQEETNKITKQQKIIEQQKQEIAQQQKIEAEKEQEVKEKEKIIGDQQKIAEEAQQELEQAQQKLEQAKEQIKQKLKDLEPKLKEAQQKLKEAQELAEKAKNPEARKKALAELDEKLEKAKKDRAEAISSDKNLELNKDEAQTTSSLLSVVNNKEVENLLLNVKAKDIATLAKNINSTLEEVSKEFKDNKTVDTLLSSVGSAINSRLAKLSNPLNDDLALAYAIKNLSDNKFADNADTLSSVVKE